jgi:Mycolic acid cyclopropane synthetase
MDRDQVSAVLYDDVEIRLIFSPNNAPTKLLKKGSRINLTKVLSIVWLCPLPGTVSCGGCPLSISRGYSTRCSIEKEQCPAAEFCEIKSNIYSMSLRSYFSAIHYADVRPHHVLALYAAVAGLQSLGLAKKLAHSILSVAASWSDGLIPLIYAGWIPDCLIRWGIRLRLRNHLQELAGINAVTELETKMGIIQQLTDMPIAVATDSANAQHYEVPSAFYDLCLGPCKKYSSGLWPCDTTTFAESEIHMLNLYCERAGVVDGMKIVDLGCGWGSLTLYLAERFPNCRITGISNSHSQREYILNTAAQRGLNVKNITIVTVRTRVEILLGIHDRCSRCSPYFIALFLSQISPYTSPTLRIVQCFGRQGCFGCCQRQRSGHDGGNV